MLSIVTTFRGADIKVEVANFCAAMDTLIDQDGLPINAYPYHLKQVHVYPYVYPQKFIKTK